MASGVTFSENVCCVCLKKNKRKNTDKYCSQCDDYFCSSCLDTIHDMIPANAGHRIQGKSDFKSVLGSTQGSLPSLPTQRCGQHPSKVLEFYCADHDEVVCSSCVALEHRSCREVKSILNDINNLYNKTKVRDMKRRLPFLKESITEILGALDEKVKKLNNSNEKAQNEIKVHHKWLQQLLEAAKKETLTQLQNGYNRINAQINEEINAYKHLLQNLEKLMSELGKVKGNHIQEFVQLKICEKLVAKSDQLQEKQQRQSSSISVSFTADSDIKAYFQQLKVLGCISTRPISKTLKVEVTAPSPRKLSGQDLSQTVVPKPCASKEIQPWACSPISKPLLTTVTVSAHRKTAKQNLSQPFIPTQSESKEIHADTCLSSSKTVIAKVTESKPRKMAKQNLSQTFVPKPCASKEKPSESKTGPLIPSSALYKEIKKTNINVRLPDDKYACDIWGCCLTEDRCLLIVDNGKKTLKRLDLRTQKVRDYITLKAEPRAVCPVSNKDVAVSLDNRTVQFVSVAEKLTCTRTLSFDHDCWGIAHHNGRLFISDRGKSVYIHGMKGKKLRKISSDTSGRDIFQATRHIAVSGAGDRMYVADYTNGLVTLDIEGNHLFTLSGKCIQAQGAWGVCTDGRNVFVCGYVSGNVFQIGQDNTPLGQMASVESPRSLCFDTQNSRLYATSDRVVVLQLE